VVRVVRSALGFLCRFPSTARPRRRLRAAGRSARKEHRARPVVAQLAGRQVADDQRLALLDLDVDLSPPLRP
jgi:hypothetical protein